MIDAATSLSTIEKLIAHHMAMLDALLAVRKLMVGEDPPAASEKVLQLPAPAPRKRRSKSKEPIIHEIEGTDVEVTPLQSEILDRLAAAEDALHAGDLARAIGNTTPAGITFAIKDLRERMAKAGCKCELNGYRGRGFRLEIDRGEE